MQTADSDDCDNTKCGVSELILPGDKFKQFSRMYSIMEEVRKLTGMKMSELAYDAKAYFSKEKAMEKFSRETFTHKLKERSIPMRGEWLCTHPSCTFSVPFSYYKVDEAYVIKDGIEDKKTGKRMFCLDHNHQTTEVHIDGYVNVQKESDLTDEERLFLENIALLNAGSPSIKVALSKKFILRDFSKDLINRVVRRVRDDHFGKDRNQLPELRQSGQRAIQSGGIWVEDISPETWRLRGTLKQTYMQRAYALEFGGYFDEADGTHGTNKYGLIAVVHVGVDSLGYSAILGIATMESENTKGIVESARKFGISSIHEDEQMLTEACAIEGIAIENRVARNSFKGTMLTDEGPWSEKTAEQCGKTHGYCSRHKTQNILKSRAGLGDLADEYIADMNKLIYRGYTEEILAEKFKQALVKYGHEPAANKFIRGLQSKKEKFCHTYMQFVFTNQRRQRRSKQKMTLRTSLLWIS